MPVDAPDNTVYPLGFIISAKVFRITYVTWPNSGTRQPRSLLSILGCSRALVAEYVYTTNWLLHHPLAHAVHSERPFRRPDDPALLTTLSFQTARFYGDLQPIET